MKIKVTNISEMAVGVHPALAPLPPGETIEELEVDDETLTALEGFDHVEIQRLDRSEGGGNKKPAKKA